MRHLFFTPSEHSCRRDFRWSAGRAPYRRGRSFGLFSPGPFSVAGSPGPLGNVGAGSYYRGSDLFSSVLHFLGYTKGDRRGKSAPDLPAIAHHRWGDLDSFGALKVAASPLKPPFSAGQGPFLFEGAVRRI